MKRVAVLVEGVSDMIFWKRVFWRTFSKYQYYFEFRQFSGRDRLIREVPIQVELFKDAKFFSVFVILDADEISCPHEIITLFKTDFAEELTSGPPSMRFAQVCIAFREIESWILADEECMQALGFDGYKCNSEASHIAGKTKLIRLCKINGRTPAGMKDREFASQAGAYFKPERARRNSASLEHSWNRVIARLGKP